MEFVRYELRSLISQRRKEKCTMNAGMDSGAVLRLNSAIATVLGDHSILLDCKRTCYFPLALGGLSYRFVDQCLHMNPLADQPLYVGDMCQLPKVPDLMVKTQHNLAAYQEPYSVRM